MSKQKVMIDASTTFVTNIIEEDDQYYIVLVSPRNIIIPIPFDSQEDAAHFLRNIFRPELTKVLNKEGSMPFTKAMSATIRNILQGDSP